MCSRLCNSHAFPLLVSGQLQVTSELQSRVSGTTAGQDAVFRSCLVCGPENSYLTAWALISKFPLPLGFEASKGQGFNNEMGTFSEVPELSP